MYFDDPHKNLQYIFKNLKQKDTQNIIDKQFEIEAIDSLNSKINEDLNNNVLTCLGSLNNNTTNNITHIDIQNEIKDILIKNNIKDATISPILAVVKTQCGNISTKIRRCINFSAPDKTKPQITPKAVNYRIRIKSKLQFVNIEAF